MATITNAGSGTFTNSCPAKTKKFVLETYLEAKIANYMGVSLNNINDLTKVRIDSPYLNSEGIINGYDKEKGWVPNLRIDLQKEQNGYACIQVQYGTGMKNNGGAYAGVLMKVDTEFTFNDLRTAFESSFNYYPVSYARLDP